MKAKQGQSFLDLVIQGTGSIENAFIMALANGVSITQNLNIGDELKPTQITNASVVNGFNENNIPATALIDSEESLLNSSEGIGEMIIEATFEIA